LLEVADAGAAALAVEEPELVVAALPPHAASTKLEARAAVASETLVRRPVVVCILIVVSFLIGVGFSWLR
jgi:hypothetical protein